MKDITESMTDDEIEIIKKAYEIISRKGFTLGYWDSWIGFGRFVSLRESVK